MIDSRKFLALLREHDLEFFAGVPDSLLKQFCSVLENDEHSVTCANEGNAIGLAAGHYLATGRIPVCYFQNSGLGNAVNPLVSLTHSDVYSIPMLLIIGWRGEPGIDDEPQHRVQGRITRESLDLLGIKYAVLPDNLPEASDLIADAVRSMQTSQSPFALLVRKDIFAGPEVERASSDTAAITREEALGVLLDIIPKNARLVASTGKLSRELFELREMRRESHERDFITVGSMGHASSIALGVALGRPDTPVVCLDGDGAVLMHMGSLATIGSRQPSNLHHFIFNNHCHESVGGQATAAPNLDIVGLARACRYLNAGSVRNCDELMKQAKAMFDTPGPALLEIKIRAGSRDNLGRPTVSPAQTKTAFLNRKR